MEQLWCEPPFQIERGIIIPNAVIPEHHHPNVDTWELCLVGGGIGWVGHKPLSIRPGFAPPVFIKHGIWHGGTTAEDGLTWLSVQQWYKEGSMSLSEDWVER